MLFSENYNWLFADRVLVVLLFLDTHVSLAPTHVRPSVRPTVTLSDFQYVSVSGRPT